MKRIFLSLLLAFSFSVQASRTLDNFGPVNVIVNGTDTYCSSYTNSLSGTNIIFTCVPASGGTPTMGAPTGCVARINSGTSNVSLSSSGGSASLSVSCATPSSGITYNWSRNGTTSVSTAASWTDNYSANVSTSVDNVFSYQVSACVTGPLCATVPVNPIAVVVSKASGGGGSWNGVCSGFDSTQIVDVSWASPTRMYPTMGRNDIIVVRFTTGNIVSGFNLPRLTAAEWNSSPSGRVATLSKTPCDFNSTFAAAGAKVGTQANPANSITAVFALGGGPDYSYYPNLLLSTTYYLNIKNATDSTCVTGNGICDMFVDLIKSNL